jgi:hypothetical protein
MDWGGWMGDEDIEDANVHQFNSTSSIRRDYANSFTHGWMAR